ncbi:MAG: hypothetical protein NTY50_11050 [Methylobacter sp.]|nr:hypothetical protein [Methylobacter sp.]
MGTWKLLVEGKDDQDFFNTYCGLTIGKNKVEVFPPKTLDASSGDGWANLIKNMPLLLGQLKNGDIEKLGIVLDADYPPDNSGGFISRYALITKQLELVGYIIPKKPIYGEGDIFSHSNGLPSIGLWIMPNHRENGMLEDFIGKMISSDADQQSLLKYVDHSIDKLPVTLFDKTLRVTKARIFTWRAWQNRPGLPLNKALNDGILDRNATSSFSAWLTNVFK